MIRLNIGPSAWLTWLEGCLKHHKGCGLIFSWGTCQGFRFDPLFRVCTGGNWSLFLSQPLSLPLLLPLFLLLSLKSTNMSSGEDLKIIIIIRLSIVDSGTYQEAKAQEKGRMWPPSYTCLSVISFDKNPTHQGQVFGIWTLDPKSACSIHLPVLNTECVGIALFKMTGSNQVLLFLWPNYISVEVHHKEKIIIEKRFFIYEAVYIRNKNWK